MRIEQLGLYPLVTSSLNFILLKFCTPYIILYPVVVVVVCHHCFFEAIQFHLLLCCSVGPCLSLGPISQDNPHSRTTVSQYSTVFDFLYLFPKHVLAMVRHNFLPLHGKKVFSEGVCWFSIMSYLYSHCYAKFSAIVSLPVLTLLFFLVVSRSDLFPSILYVDGLHMDILVYTY